MSNLCLFFAFVLSFLVHVQNGASIDYGTALTKSILFYEAQRSGKLPSNQRIKWRGDSGLNDGKNEGIDLVGGYYDAGDNIKFGLPMGFTVTMLGWSVVEFGQQLRARNELGNALSAIKWGTDYFMKAHPTPNVLYGQVGDGSDHSCWHRPEDMTTLRTAYKIDDHHPGSDLAAETSAAFAAASLAFKDSNPTYSAQLLKHAKQLFEFARQHTGLYQNSIPAARQFYASSGYEDELLWAAAWLRRATNDNTYLQFLNSTNSGGTQQMFSWDNKYVGAQLLIAQEILRGKIRNTGKLNELKKNAEQFICNCVQKGNKNAKKTKGGLLYFMEWSNLQYVTSASFIMTAYAQTLSTTGSTLQCPGGVVGPHELTGFARSQVDYILGSNPNKMSYMVGYGPKYPKRIHHRGASVISQKTDARAVGCQNEWFYKNADNPNVVDGAIVGGADEDDQYRDSRDNFKQGEPATANNAPIVGVLATLAAAAS